MPATQAPVTPPASDQIDLVGYTRLASCPQCDGRRRVLVEVGDQLRGRCLECGAELPLPLATETQGRLVLVGRGGQGIFTLDIDD
jgi:hypothetical protein